jgi:hypothetical protein
MLRRIVPSLPWRTLSARLSYPFGSNPYNEKGRPVHKRYFYSRNELEKLMLGRIY